MSDPSLRVARSIPLPTGDEPEAWLLDTTPWRQVFKVYFEEPYPFHYSPIGRRVRLLMPTRGLMRVDRLLKELADYARTIPDGGVILGLSPEWSPQEKATVMLVQVICEPDTNYIAYTVWPNGRVVAFSGAFEEPYNQRRSWHPSVPWGGLS